jgi:hypothetical protein
MGPDLDLCVRTLPSEDTVALSADTAWRVPWELLMLGPFTSCVLHDGDLMRHVTATSMIRSALRCNSNPASALTPDDYPPLMTLLPDMTVMDAVRSVVDNGWDLAVVMHAEPRLITSRTVIRSLLNFHEGSPLPDQPARMGPIALPLSWTPAPTKQTSPKPRRTSRA